MSEANTIDADWEAWTIPMRMGMVTIMFTSYYNGWIDGAGVADFDLILRCYTDNLEDRFQSESNFNEAIQYLQTMIEDGDDEEDPV